MTWNDLPIELVDSILTYIASDDAKSLRCVSKSFERKVSPSFFRSVVIPFNSELRDMVQRDLKPEGVCISLIETQHT